MYSRLYRVFVCFSVLFLFISKEQGIEERQGLPELCWPCPGPTRNPSPGGSGMKKKAGSAEAMEQ